MTNTSKTRAKQNLARPAYVLHRLVQQLDPHIISPTISVTEPVPSDHHLDSPPTTEHPDDHLSAEECVDIILDEDSDKAAQRAQQLCQSGHIRRAAKLLCQI